MQIDEVQAWTERWKEVARAEITELRRLPVEVKLRQLDALAQSASLFEWPRSGEDEDGVRVLWLTLRRRSALP